MATAAKPPVPGNVAVISGGGQPAELAPRPPTETETGTTVPVPGFSQPRRRPADPLPPQAEVTGPQPEPETAAAGSGSGGGRNGSTGSTDRADRKVIEDAAAGAAALGLQAAGGLLNMRLVPEGDMSFLPDDHDLDMVAPPLGRIAARHAPLPDIGGKELSDLQDAIAAAIGLAGWLIRGFAGWVGARARARRQPAVAEKAADSHTAIA